LQLRFCCSPGEHSGKRRKLQCKCCKHATQDIVRWCAEGYKVDDAEGDILSQGKDLGKRPAPTTQTGVGALALDRLMYSFQGALHMAKYYLNWTHAPKPPYKVMGGTLMPDSDIPAAVSDAAVEIDPRRPVLLVFGSGIGL